MDSERLMWTFIDRLNREVVDTLDYPGYGLAVEKRDCGALSASLQQLHQAFRAVYLTQDLESGFSKALVPAVLFSPDREMLLLGLAHLDLTNGGALSGCSVLTPFGLHHPQDGADTPAAVWVENNMQTPPLCYCTVLAPGDAPADYLQCPIKILAMLAACREEPITTLLRRTGQFPGL